MKAAGAVLIAGPRGCGKTATGRRHAASEVLLDTDENALMLAAIDPAAVPEGEAPRLIDEWQLEPRLWNHVRRAVDGHRGKGQFILTSSATPWDEALRHSRAARVLRLRMRTLSMAESGHSTAQVSLKDLLAGKRLPALRSDETPSVRQLAEINCRGGWPDMLDAEVGQVTRLLRSYLNDVARIDLPKLEGRERREPELVRCTLASVARHTATEVTYATSAVRDHL